MAGYTKETIIDLINHVPGLKEAHARRLIRIDDKGLWIATVRDPYGESALTEAEDDEITWTPTCELDGDDAPDPLGCPAVPVPFSARELAAFMVDGIGALIPEVFGPLMLELEQSELAGFRLKSKKTKEALLGAYSAFRAAEPGLHHEYPSQSEYEQLQYLREQYESAFRQAKKKHQFYDDGISAEEQTNRVARAKADAQPALHAWRDEDARVTEKQNAWRREVVNRLVGKSSGKFAGAEDWRQRVRDAATEWCKNRAGQGMSRPTKIAVAKEMEIWCRNNEVFTLDDTADGKKGGINPGVETLRRHVLRSWKIP